MGAGFRGGEAGALADASFVLANGQIDNVRVAPGVIDRTFHLLPRHH